VGFDSVYRAKADVETVVGTALMVHLPAGDYMDDKLINLGTNRFTFRPQLVAVKARRVAQGRAETLRFLQ